MPLTSFHPVDDGFKFRNDFVNPIISVPALGIDVRTFGRCGGMAFLALDYWFSKLPIPETSTLPVDGTVLADTIYARLTTSMIDNGIRYFDFMNMLDHPTWLRGKGAAKVTREDEFPRIRSSIDAGRPCALGLCRARDIGSLGNDHQVVCFGYETDATNSRLYIYDNNFPDQVATLDFATQYDPANRPVRHSITNTEWRGFFMETYLPRPPWYLNEGTLLRETSEPAVNQIKAGASCWINSPSEFDQLGLSWTNVRRVGDGSFSQIEAYAGDGMLVKDRDDPRVYIVFGGKPFHIPSPDELFALGHQWTDVIELPSGSASRMRALPRDRTLLKELSNDAIFVVQNGQTRHITSPAVFDAHGYHPDNVRVVPNGSLASFERGAPIG